jgi:hypothetical protein
LHHHHLLHCQLHHWAWLYTRQHHLPLGMPYRVWDPLQCLFFFAYLAIWRHSSARTQPTTTPAATEHHSGTPPHTAARMKTRGTSRHTWHCTRLRDANSVTHAGDTRPPTTAATVRHTDTPPHATMRRGASGPQENSGCRAQARDALSVTCAYDKPPMAAITITTARRHHDELGGPLRPPLSSFLGNTPVSRRSTRHWVGIRAPHPPTAAIAVAIARAATTTAARCHSLIWATPQCHAEARDAGSAHASHARQQLPSRSRLCGHSTTWGRQLCPPLLPAPPPGALASRTSTRRHVDGSHA